MNAFDDARTVEDRGMEIICPQFSLRCDEGRYVTTDKGRLSKLLQNSVGDALLQIDGKVVGVEVKCEETCQPGNFFLETWSNRKRFTPGWLYKLNTDLLFYYFLEQDLLYVFSFPRVRRWAFVPAGSSPCFGRAAGDSEGRSSPLEAIRRARGAGPRSSGTSIRRARGGRAGGS